MAVADDLERVEVSSADELRAWLEAHHAQSDSVWLVTFKKHVPDRHVTTEQVLDELVAFGWTDGVRRKLDAKRTMQLVSPRRTQYWAKSYKDRALRLSGAGRMHPAGREAIERAKVSGLWGFMDDVDALRHPPDLDEALAAHSGAADYFASTPPSYRRNALRWIKLARTPATRARRLERVVTASAGERRIRHL